MSIWQIQGEAGKAMDGTMLDIEDLGWEDLTVSFQSAGIDRLTATIALPDASGAGVVAPELRQKVTLWRAGVRYISGICTRSRPVLQRENWTLQIEVAGPGWFLDQTPLTSVQTDQAGSTATRVAFVFGTGDLKASFEGLTTRSIALDAPIALGSIATMYDVPRITVVGGSLLSGFADLMRWVPDAMMWFDYSASSPELMMTRRLAGLAVGSAATRTITIGIDDVRVLDLQPQIELQVARVTIDSATRDAQGRALYQSSSAGTATTGRNQVVVVSGPETIDTSLPLDQFESVVVRSLAHTVSSRPRSEVFETYDQQIKATGATGFGIGPFTETTTLPTGTYTLPAVTPKIEKKDGGALSSGMNYFLLKGETKDWWLRDGIEWEQARAQATIYYRIESPTPPPNGYSPNPPDWVVALAMQHDFYNVTSGGSYKRVDIYFTTSAVLVPVCKTLWSTDTTIYRQEDYSFAVPPAGLAANLLAAQDFIPYAGTIELAHDEVPAGNPVGTCINVAGGPAALTAMRGMVQAAEMDILNGIERLRLGASPRLSYEDLVARFRRTGYDTFDFVSNAQGGALRPS